MGSRLLLAALFVILLASRMPAAETTGGPESNESSNPTAGTPADYVLQPSDVIRVVFYQDHDMDTETRVGHDGVVTLPLIKEVTVGGKTILEAQEIIRQLYDRDYLVNPQIGLSVVDYAKVTVSVLGSVGSPGSIQLPSDQSLNLVDAIAKVGGFTRLADRKHVKLTRTDHDGKVSTNDINVDDIIKGESPSAWPLQKGDVIYVPERLL